MPRPSYLEQHEQAVCRAPERKLRHVQTEVALQERIRLAVGHALPGERHLAASSRDVPAPTRSPSTAPLTAATASSAPGVSASLISRLATFRRTCTDPTAR